MSEKNNVIEHSSNIHTILHTFVDSLHECQRTSNIQGFWMPEVGDINTSLVAAVCFHARVPIFVPEGGKRSDYGCADDRKYICMVFQVREESLTKLEEDREYVRLDVRGDTKRKTNDSFVSCSFLEETSIQQKQYLAKKLGIPKRIWGQEKEKKDEF